MSSRCDDACRDDRDMPENRIDVSYFATFERKYLLIVQPNQWLSRWRTPMFPEGLFGVNV